MENKCTKKKTELTFKLHEQRRGNREREQEREQKTQTKAKARVRNGKIYRNTGRVRRGKDNKDIAYLGEIYGCQTVNKRTDRMP